MGVFEGEVVLMKKFIEKLPKTVKVFFYIAISIVLSELLIELGNLEKTFIIRVLAQIINLVIVFLEEAIPEVKARLK